VTALPRISKPATEALAAAGITTLEQAAKHSETELLALHGMGPKGIRILNEALATVGKRLAR
jgi:predicted flap endonuclease-1-like 5' DNA nuclease